jgi:uncharacterized protein with FMN-binding domain
MKRALLIATGTVGGLGAVLAITPPQLGSTSAINIAGAGAVGVGSGSAEVAPASSSSVSAVATKSAKPVATKKAVTTKQPVDNVNAAVATTSPAASAATTAVNGSFTGPSVFAKYGDVQVKITVVNGRITDAVAVKAPSGRNDRWTNMAVPILKEQTLKAQSANIQGASGASYTSYGWYTSLQGALAQAGL